MPRTSSVKRRLRAGALGGALALLTAHVAAADPARVLSLGGSVTEIVYALGAQDRLVARDTTSSYPAAANDLPDVGYIRALSPEGVLSVNPDLILSEAGAGPAETLEVLKSANIPFIEMGEGFDADAIAAKITTIGHHLDKSAEAETLVRQMRADLDLAARAAQEHRDQDRKRVLFVLSLRGGRIMASGSHTAADAMIRLAGAVNAVDSFEGYKPMTDEAVSNARPDVILMMDRAGQDSADAAASGHGASDDELFALPALITTPAAQSRSAVRMDGLYLLGFGPRTGAAARDLARAIYGEAG